MQRLKILITGTSKGIGKATAELFLSKGHEVIGIDKCKSTITNKNYTHIKKNLGGKGKLPTIESINIIVNNAGTIKENNSLAVNIKGYKKVIDRYAYQEAIKSVVNVASISAQTGFDTPYYCASQGARIAYTKYLANELGKKYHAIVNSISPGAVHTSLEPKLYKDDTLMKMVANENIFQRWIKPEEIAKIIYFMTVENSCITGQDILADNGEFINHNFISS